MFENICVPQLCKRSKHNRSSCAVPNCTSIAYKNPSLSFFRFPSLQHDKNGCLTARGEFNMHRRRQWIISLRIGQKITDRSVVCAKHFKRSDFAWSGAKRARPHLKRTAVPCLSVPFVCTDKFKQMGFVTPPTKIWKKDDIIALISLYKSEKCLYDRNDPDYSRPAEKFNAYKKIQQELMTNMRTDCSVSQIRSKIQTLKDQYIVEKINKDKCIQSGLYSERTYEPLWFFEHLRFLDDYVINETNTNLIKKGSSQREKQYESLISNPVSDNKDLKGPSYGTMCKMVPAIVYLKQKHEENDIDTANEQCESLASNSETDGEIEDREQDIEDQQCESLASNSEIDGDLEDIDQDIKDHQCESFASNSETDEQSNEENSRNRSLFSTSEIESHSKEEDFLTNSCEREDTFGSYIASKMRLFRDNPLLYLQTEQAIVQILNRAHLKNIKSN